MFDIFSNIIEVFEDQKVNIIHFILMMAGGSIRLLLGSIYAAHAFFLKCGRTPGDVEGLSAHILGLRTYVTCSAILGLLDRHDDLRASHKLLNTERIL